MRQQDDEFLAGLRRVLSDPEHDGNPLLVPLAELLDRHLRQRRLLERIMRISDSAQAQLRDVNLTLQAASLTDPLTGLANRRHLIERFQRETVRARRTGRPMVVMLADVDRFKSVNDTWGHETGDAVLGVIADVLQANLREYDLCGRWGGEEFLIILPETALDGGLAVAEKLRVAVAGCRAGGPVHPEIEVSLSVGIAEYDPDMPIEVSISRADRALYEAKTGGRNRCVTAKAA